MWCTRSIALSTCPNIIVALVNMPSECATYIVVSHASASHLPSPIFRRTGSAKISPPPPGSESSPASLSRTITHRIFASSESPGGSKKFTNSIISGGLNAWMCTPGNFALIDRSSPVYHSIGSAGFIPPCIRICVPPIATSSAILSWIASCDSVYESWSSASRRKAQNVHRAVQTLV